MIDLKKMSRAELICWIASIVFLVVGFFLPRGEFFYRLCQAGFMTCLFIPMMLKDAKKHFAAGIDERSRFVHDVCRLCLFSAMSVASLIVVQPLLAIVSYLIMALGLLLCAADFFLYKKITGLAVWDEAYVYDLLIVFAASFGLA